MHDRILNFTYVRIGESIPHNIYIISIMEPADHFPSFHSTPPIFDPENPNPPQIPL